MRKFQRKSLFGVCLLSIPLHIACGTEGDKGANSNVGRFVPIDSERGFHAQSRAIEKLSHEKQTSVPTGEGHTFTAVSLVVDEDGSEHVRYKRAYRGLEFVAGDFVVHSGRNHSDVDIDVSTQSVAEPPTLPNVTVEQATAIARAHFDGQVNSVSTGKLVLLGTPEEPVLAWQILVRGIGKTTFFSAKKSFVDATTGEFIESWETVQTIAATGKTFYFGDVNLEVEQRNNVYVLSDPTRGNTRTTTLNGSADVSIAGSEITSINTVFGNGTLANLVTLAADAQFGAAATWDYFLQIHKRTGIANNSAGILSRVHFGQNVANAFWSNECFCATYGNGDGTNMKPLVALDVSAHELSHGLTSATAGLIYQGESGGLNEATSDIFATMVEFFVDNKNDTPDYLIGEEVMINRPALRVMYQPSLDGQSLDCYTPQAGSADVHHSSGIGNHFFYLLAEGSTPPGPLPKSPTCNNSELKGIGRDKAAQIWYRALTVYMTPRTNYQAARFATLRAARDLYGATSAEVRTVAAAWEGVSVLNRAAPTIGTIQSLALKEDEASNPITFSIADPDSPISCEGNITLTSDNPALITESSVKIQGSAGNCSMLVTPLPNASGKANIELIVADEGKLSSKAIFNVEVTAVNDAPELSDLSKRSVTSGKTTANINFTLKDQDNKLSCKDAVKANTQNPELISAVEVSGGAPRCQLSVTALANATGVAKIDLTASDGSANSTATLELEVSKIAALITANRLTAKAPAWIDFSGEQSGSEGSTLTEWNWDFGDQTHGGATNFEKSFTVPGEYTVTLTVRDNSGNTTASSVTVKIE